METVFFIRSRPTYPIYGLVYNMYVHRYYTLRIMRYVIIRSRLYSRVEFISIFLRKKTTKPVCVRSFAISITRSEHPSFFYRYSETETNPVRNLR